MAKLRARGGVPEFRYGYRSAAAQGWHYFSDDALAYFEPNDPADLAKQMVRLYLDRELRSRLVAKAKDEYTGIRWDVMKERYLLLIESLIGTPRREMQPSAAVPPSVVTQ